jgi:hypothetical protein
MGGWTMREDELRARFAEEDEERDRLGPSRALGFVLIYCVAVIAVAVVVVLRLT